MCLDELIEVSGRSGLLVELLSKIRLERQKVGQAVLRVYIRDQASHGGVRQRPR